MEEIPFDIEVLRKKLLRGDIVSLQVVSDSMEPVIKTGESIDVGHISLKSLRPFDIILFFQGGRLNTHLLVKTDEINNQFITQPLKLPKHNDYPLSGDEILGIVKNKKLNLWHRLRVSLRN
ncbi:MAG: hypothetical protein NXH75_00015 [Halobacteriovoraceae bacterium]|nr:hypothetical protein [Halobacteriovoraceae bacterium]